MLINMMNPITPTERYKRKMYTKLQNGLQYLHLMNETQNNRTGQNSYMTVIFLRLLFEIQSHKLIDKHRNRNMLKVLSKLGMIKPDLPHSSTLHMAYQFTSNGSYIMNKLGIHPHMHPQITDSKSNHEMSTRVFGQLCKGALGFSMLLAGTIGTIVVFLIAITDETGLTFTEFIKPIMLLALTTALVKGGAYLMRHVNIDLSIIPVSTVNTITKASFFSLILATRSARDNIEALNPYVMDIINYEMFQTITS